MDDQARRMAEAACWQHCWGVVGRGLIASVCNSGGFLMINGFIIGGVGGVIAVLAVVSVVFSN